jgi:hypothetical protein
MEVVAKAESDIRNWCCRRGVTSANERATDCRDDLAMQKSKICLRTGHSGAAGAFGSAATRQCGEQRSRRLASVARGEQEFGYKVEVIEGEVTAASVVNPPQRLAAASDQP